ncbi:MAG: hypothetical protein WCI62_00445 [Erysipelotrichaceae bacterium]
MAKYKTLSDFYKSPEWITLRKRLMVERSTPEKGLLCQKCHEPILKDPECIAHHIIELTPMNVNDVKISLNPNNILLVHHQCHNQIHERFGQESGKKVFLVYGAPLSGKTSYVKAHKKRSDLVLDLDELYQAITLLPAYDKPLELSTNVFLLRDALLDQIKTRTGKWTQAWIIGGYPLNTDRERLATSLGAELIFIQATEDECLSRLLIDLDKLPYQVEWQRYIHDWFIKFRPTLPPGRNLGP